MKQIVRFLRKHTLLTSIGIIILVILFFVFRPKPQKAIDTQTIKRTHLVQSVSVTGTIAAKNFANLSFLTGGRLVYLGVQRGDHVNQYQTLATLDQRTVQDNLETALLDYSEQRNTFDQTQDNNQNRKPEQALNDAMKRILQNNQYDLDKSVKSVELQSFAKEQSVLVSPINGIVTRADASTIGVNIAPTAVFTVVDPNSMVFDMDVDEADIGRIKEGQPVNITFDTYPDTTLHLTVRSIDFVSHTTSTGGTAYTVEVPLTNNAAYQYRVGMDGNGEIITAEKENVLTVPISSIFSDTYLYIKTNHGYQRRKVRLGLESDTEAEVVNGVSEGESVVLQPASVPQK